MGRTSTRPEIRLPDTDRTRLEHIVSHPRSPRKHVWRARIILALGDGCGLVETMRRTGLSKPAVWRWRDRFLSEGVEGLLRDATRPPGKQPIPAATVQAVINLAMSPPPPNRRHWTLKALTTAVGGLTATTVHRILQRHGLRPHQVRTFKVSNDPRFGIKAHDVIGLYMNPPDHAVVLSVDEKTRIQALGRTRTPLPPAPGHAATRTHDYRRNGTTTLLAALDVATGKVVGQMTERHRSEDFCAFLDHVAVGIDPEAEVHVILDNLSAHKSALVHAWLADHPDWHFHFTPRRRPGRTPSRGSSRNSHASGSRMPSSTPLTSASPRWKGTSRTTTPMRLAPSAGAGIPGTSWPPGSAGTGGCKIGNCLYDTKH